MCAVIAIYQIDIAAYVLSVLKHKGLTIYLPDVSYY